MSIRTPKYRYHKARDCAVVTLGGRDHYLGPYGSAPSHEKYHRLVAEHLAALGAPAEPGTSHLTIAELLAAYWRFAKQYYVKRGEPTSELPPVKQALRFLRRLYGPTPASDFTPKRLKAVRQAMVSHAVTRRRIARDPDTGAARRNPATGEPVWETVVLRQGLARRTINKQIGRVKRVFAWAVEEELVPVAVHAALQRVRGLRKGVAGVREKPPVRGVSPADVEAVLPHLPAPIAAMVRVQQLTGMRPQEVVAMRGVDIRTANPVWEYVPERYKTEHRNDDDDPDRGRIVYLGPNAQAVLSPYLEEAGADYLFSPCRAEAVRYAALRQARTSPVPTSQANRPTRGRTRAPLRAAYDVASYRRAIRRACLRCGIPPWSPNQLRHLRLTEIRHAYGLEASRVCGGHREVGVTQHYAEQDRTLARRVMAEAG